MQACLDYVMQLPGVKVDLKHVATAGVSNGGYMAAPVASRYSIYTHALMFHAMCVHVGCPGRPALTCKATITKRSLLPFVVKEFPTLICKVLQKE